MEKAVRPSESASTAVKRVIGDLEDCRASQLGTLSRVVDMRELDAVIGSASTLSEEWDQSVSFQYCGYSVEVFSNQVIYIES